MRYFPTTLLAAGLAFALAAPAGAAPNSINDCEKIEAADAYNQCLAMFGPVAHTRGASTKDFGGDGVGGRADVVEKTNPEASVPVQEAHASHGRHSHGHWAHSAHHRYYGHNYSHHGHSSAYETHGKAKRVAFNVISGHTRTR